MEKMDKYEINARYIPTFISVIPLVHFLILLLGKEFWGGLANEVSGLVVVSDLGLSLILMITMIQIQCVIGKFWIEKHVFEKRNKNFPAVDMILLSDKIQPISESRKKLIRKQITDSHICVLKGDNIKEAQEAVEYVKVVVKEGFVTSQYNIRYGFFRNLIAGVYWSVFGSIGCAIIYLIAKDWKAAGFFISLALIYLILFRYKNVILEQLAIAYSDALFDEFLLKVMAIFPQKPESQQQPLPAGPEPTPSPDES